MWIDSSPLEDLPLSDVHVFLEQGYFGLTGQLCSDFLHTLPAGQISMLVTFSQNILSWEGPTKATKCNSSVNGPYGD